MHLKPTRIFLVYFPALLIDFAFSSVLTNSAFYSSYLSLSSTFLGILVAIVTAFYAFLAIPLGKLSDKIDRTLMLYAGCILISIVSIVIPLCYKKIHLLLIFPLLGISLALFWPTYEAWLAEREGEGTLLHRVMLFNLFWSIGITMGPTVSGYLYQDDAPFRPFYLACVLGLLTLTVLLLSKSSQEQVDSEPQQSTQTLFPPPEVRRRYLNIARCANFASYFALAVLRWLAPKLTKEMGIPTVVFGNLMLTLGSFQTITFLFLGTGYSTRWHYRLSPMVITQVLAILSLVILWRVQHMFIWFIAFVIIGISVAFSYFGSLYYGLDQHTDKGNKSGWHEAVLGFGSLLGPLICGIAADSEFGMQSPYLVCAFVILVAIFVEVIIASRIKSATNVL